MRYSPTNVGAGSRACWSSRARTAAPLSSSATSSKPTTATPASTARASSASRSTLADHLNLSPERQRNLEFAALLHDVGKIAIPKEIINKPGKLDPHEWTIIKTHTLEGQKMLERVGGFMRQVGHIVRSHHERWDGAGYPDGLIGEAIPLEARIITCCDTWNAMRTDRPYRSALAHDIAVAELSSNAGTQLDPGIVAALVEIVAPEAPAPQTAEASAPQTAPAPAPQSAPQTLTPGAAGAPQPRLEYGYARPAC